MGLRLFSSSTADAPVILPFVPNPDPKDFLILKSEQIGKYLVVKVKYPGCTNYEGIKILVYRGVSLDKLILQNSLDPHFAANPNYISPIARFVPTDQGWKMAKKLCKLI